MKKMLLYFLTKKENKESLSVTISLLPLRVPFGRELVNDLKLEYSPAIQTLLYLHLYPHFLLTGHILISKAKYFSFKGLCQEKVLNQLPLLYTSKDSLFLFSTNQVS